MTVGLGILIALLSLPDRRADFVGLDTSWRIALHLAVEERLSFGSGLVFSYGPLGFLFAPQPFLGTSSLAASYVDAGVHLTLCILLLRCARRAFPLGIALGIAYLAARVSISLEGPETVVVTAFVVGVAMIVRGRSSPVPAWVVVAFGLGAGPAVLGKINTGLVVIGIGLVASAFAHRPWWRSSGVFLASSAGAALLGWLLSGQPVEDVVPFIDHSIDFVVGYSAAMGVAGDELIGHLFAAGICIAILAAIGARVSEGWPTSARIGLALLGAGFAYASWKTGFTRWHYHFFFATAVLALFPLMLDRVTSAASSWAFVALLLGFVAAVSPNPISLLNPAPSIANVTDFIAMATDGDRRASVVARYRSQMRAKYALPPEALTLLRGRTVHSDPVETGIMWAYPELDWLPYPVFQSYAAFTAELDALNAASLATAGPDFLIREVFSIDARHAWWEAPQAMLEVLCRYREVLVTGRWQIVERGAPRCGVERRIGMADVGPGEAVAVPQAGEGEIVVARVHGLEPTIGDRLLTFLLRGPEWHVTVNHGPTYRVVPAHAGGPLLMSVPASVGYTPPHSFPEAIVSLSFARVDDPAAATAAITVEFFAIEFGTR